MRTVMDLSELMIYVVGFVVLGALVVYTACALFGFLAGAAYLVWLPIAAVRDGIRRRRALRRERYVKRLMGRNRDLRAVTPAEGHDPRGLAEIRLAERGELPRRDTTQEDVERELRRQGVPLVPGLRRAQVRSYLRAQAVRREWSS